MNLFDEYVESLLHFNLNFYLAFSPERGRTVGELVTIISSALARSGVSCTAAEVNRSIEARVASNDGFVQASQDKIWLNFVSIPSTPTIPAPVVAVPPQPSPGPMAAHQALADGHLAETTLHAHLGMASLSWEQRIWNTEFARLAADLNPGEVDAKNFPIRLLVAAYGKLRKEADDQFKEEYLLGLEDVLNNLIPGNKLKRLSSARVVALTNIGETSTEKVMFASARVIELMAGWVA